MSFRNKALEYMTYGLNPVPVQEGTKAPIRKDHSQVRITEAEVDDFEWRWIGISTGSVSQGLEVLDFDLKNAEDPDVVIKGFKSKVSHKLLKKLIFQKTQSGGYHVMYRCEALEGSRVLAKNAEGAAVIETRGEGGFIVCAPTQGYTLLQGDFSKIPIITPEERLELFISARMLNKQIQKEADKNRGRVSEWHDRFPEYDADISIGLQLLQDHGWTVHSEDEDWINLTRPNKDHGISAGYNKDGKFLYVFSSSTNFEESRPYNNHDIYAELVCGGRYNVAYAKLYEAGHGVGEVEEGTFDAAEWEEILRDIKFISTIDEEREYLEQARKDQIPLGLSTGWPALDEYHRIKSNSLNMAIAYDGVGKSVYMNALAVSTNILHDLKWGMVVPENKTAVTRRRLIELKAGKEVKYFGNNKDQFEEHLRWAHKNFFITTNKKHYSLKEAIQMGVRLFEYHGINCFLIDPYNFFRVDGKNGYSWNNEILSQLRVFADKYCSVYVMAHPASDSPRKNKDADGYLKAPSPYDIQGGADFPYRVDDFFVMHRIKNHRDAEIRRTMQIMMTKVKEEETGGKVHSMGDFTELEYKVQDGFLGYWDKDGNNPMYTAMYPQGKLQPAGVGDFVGGKYTNSPFD